MSTTRKKSAEDGGGHFNLPVFADNDHQSARTAFQT